jgi:hypothetical protein
MPSSLHVPAQCAHPRPPEPPDKDDCMGSDDDVPTTGALKSATLSLERGAGIFAPGLGSISACSVEHAVAYSGFSWKIWLLQRRCPGRGGAQVRPSSDPNKLATTTLAAGGERVNGTARAAHAHKRALNADRLR